MSDPSPQQPGHEPDQPKTDSNDWRQFALKPQFAERVWGRRDLQPFYADPGTANPVGEAWLTGPACVVAGGELAGKTLAEVVPSFPLLVKLLFPDEKLSVQVHPDDEAARSMGMERGKTECWYVLEAQPGARVACGVQDGVTAEEIQAGVEDGSLEKKLQWLPVQQGDMVYVDAGTVHAIGPGVTLLEVQQTSDVTYRLYDYNRPRELHLQDALRVLKLRTRAGKVPPKSREGYTRLIETAYFHVDLFELPPNMPLEMPVYGTSCVVALRGRGAVNETRFQAGEAVMIPDGSVTMTSPEGCTFVRCTPPAPAE